MLSSWRRIAALRLGQHVDTGDKRSYEHGHSTLVARYEIYNATAQSSFSGTIIELAKIFTL
jgi:hypothetical protein